MSKKKRVNDFLAYLDSRSLRYRILNKNKWGYAQHVRIEGVLDFWPATGTYKCKGKDFVKKQPEKLVVELKALESSDIKRVRYTPKQKTKLKRSPRPKQSTKPHRINPIAEKLAAEALDKELLQTHSHLC